MSDERWTVRRMLRWMSEDFGRLGIATPRLDGELLIAAALGVRRVQLYMDMERPLDGAELAAIRESVRRRRAFEPVAYILGEREFYGRPFKVDARVLVPRPDTERLVDEALALMPGDGAGLRALDLCTGSGCIGLTLAAERTELHVTLTDLSPDALAVARENAERLGVSDRCTFLQGDLLEPLSDTPRFDLVACNPPYIREDEMATLSPDVAKHEPRMALVAEEAGLACYRRVLAAVAEHMVSGGHLLFEVGQGQAKDVLRLADQAGFRDGRSLRDLGAIDRVVAARSPQA